MAQNQAVVKFQGDLTTLFANKPCPMCSKQDWEVGEVFCLVGTGSGGNPLLAANRQHVIPVMCKECGHTDLFSIKAKGIKL